MNKKLFIMLFSSLLLSAPAMMLAFNSGNVPVQNSTANVDSVITNVLNFFWPIVISFAVIMFLIAEFFFLSAQGDPDKLAVARNAAFLGVVSVVIAILAFSIPFIIKNTISI